MTRRVENAILRGKFIPVDNCYNRLFSSVGTRSHAPAHAFFDTTELGTSDPGNDPGSSDPGSWTVSRTDTHLTVNKHIRMGVKSPSHCGGGDTFISSSSYF